MKILITILESKICLMDMMIQLELTNFKMWSYMNECVEWCIGTPSAL